MGTAFFVLKRGNHILCNMFEMSILLHWLATLHGAARAGRGKVLPYNDYLYDRGALQEYILLVSQYPHGGFIDKPTKCVIMTSCSVSVLCPCGDWAAVDKVRICQYHESFLGHVCCLGIENERSHAGHVTFTTRATC